MAMAKLDRGREADAFLASRGDLAPTTVSACDGWTAHEVTAHMAGTCSEISRHLRPYLDGEDVPETRSFEEREAPFQALADAALIARLEEADAQMRSDLAAVLGQEPEAVIPWTGRQMMVKKFLPHMRNEYAMHRWDMVGDDDVGNELLSQQELTDHSVGVLGEILLRRGREHDPSPDDDLAVTLRAPGNDIRLVVADGTAALHPADDRTDRPAIDFDAAARLLFIWGRRPDHLGRVVSHLDQPVLARVQSLLAGY
jgi:hypothetical protein